MGEVTAVTSTSFDGLHKIASGKVRDLYEVDANTLLFVATDRISAFDVIMENGIPSKGELLTLLSTHWFNILPTILPKDSPPLRTHFISSQIPSQLTPKLSASELSLLKNRSQIVRRLRIFPLEAIVRGYITGSAWREYSTKQTVHTIPLPAGLQNSQALTMFPPYNALYTPSTKAEAGQHDENISPAEAAAIVGEKYAKKIEQLALALYAAARDYALERGIIIADTKFEFGLDEETDEVVLVDEVLTPDSSRFWPKDEYVVGKEQGSFDKEYLRSWLVKEGLKGKEGVRMPEEVAQGTASRYREAYERLTGKKWE